MESYGVVQYLTQAQVDKGEGDSLVGVRIAVINTSNVPTGVIYESGIAGAAPTQLVTGANINTVLQTAGGAGWEKVQIATTGYQLKPSTSGASRDFHVEAGGELALLEVADWPIPTSPKVDVFKIRNFSGSVVTFEIGAGYAGIVTADDNAATPAASSYNIRNDGMVVISIDSDGWVQVVPSAEVTQTEFDLLGGNFVAHGTNVANPHSVTKAQVGLGSVDNTSDVNKPVVTTSVNGLMASTDKVKLNGIAAGAEVNIQADWNATTGDALILNKPNIYATVIAAKTDIDLPSAYPTGISMFYISSNAGTTWPIGYAAIVTTRLAAGRTAQVLYGKGTGKVFVRAEDTNVWSAWKEQANKSTPIQEYSASATYAVGDQAIQANVLYKCNTAITVAEAFTGSKWDAVGSTVTVNDTLTSTSTTEALSANQGKVLQDGKASTAVATTSTAGLLSESDKTKLDGVATGAEVNVQSDWDATGGDAQILNKPTIPPALTIQQTNALAVIQSTPTQNHPNMTSNSQAGTLGTYITSANSEHVAGVYQAWRAFNSTVDNDWATSNLWQDCWIRIQYPVAKVITRIAVEGRADANSSFVAGWLFQGSNDGTNWTTLYTGATAMPFATVTPYDIPNTTAYTYYRCFGSAPAATSVGMGTFLLYEDQYNFPIVSV